MIINVTKKYHEKKDCTKKDMKTVQNEKRLDHPYQHEQKYVCVYSYIYFNDSEL